MSKDEIVEAYDQAIHELLEVYAELEKAIARAKNNLTAKRQSALKKELK